MKMYRAASALFDKENPLFRRLGLWEALTLIVAELRQVIATFLSKPPIA